MDTQQAPIKDILDQITNPNTELYLSQSYKGFLFTEPVKYKTVHSDQIHLMVNHKVFCFCHTKDAILHDQMYKSKISGQVASFDMQSGSLFFQNVQPRKDLWVNRKELRIQPQESLVAILRTRGEYFRGCIDNLSLHGAGFLLHVSEINDKLPKSGQTIALQFELSDEIKLLIPGKITNIKTLSNQLFGIGLKLNPDEKQQALLSRYLQTAYQNMLEEIDDEYRKLLEPRAAVDLYF